MSTSKPIAVGTNDSAQSQAAVVWAARRAEQAKVPLVIVHVVDDRWLAAAPPWVEALQETGNKLLKDAASRVRGKFPIEVITKLMTGSVGGSLRKYSAKASMLVVGSGSGHVGGSLTDLALQVAAAAKCPVAVIGTQDLNGRHGIVVGVDGSEESVQSVAFAAAEADRDGQELTVLHAFSGPNRLVDAGLTPDNLAELIVEEERLVLAETVAGLREDYPDLIVNKVLEAHKDPVEALLEASTEAKMLVVGSRGRGGFRRLLLGSTAHGVLTHLPCPTVITRTQRMKHLA